MTVPVVSLQFYRNINRARHQSLPMVYVNDLYPLVISSHSSPHPKGEGVWIIDAIGSRAARAQGIKVPDVVHTCSAR